MQFKTIEYLRNQGIRVVYSDTDSFFIALEGRDPNEVVKTLNQFLAQFGLEADVEDVWDLMYIYAKKNYILRKGDKVIIKGSAIKNLDKWYTPQCISLIELLRIEDREERKRYVHEAIMSADLEQLFVRGHQQIWRLISKDPQSMKRARDKVRKYLRVTSPWLEIPYLYLKKMRGGQILLPSQNPILALFLEQGEVVDLTVENPFNIVELLSLKLDGWLARLRARIGDFDLLIYTDSVYAVKLREMYYLVEKRGEIKRVPTWYEDAPKFLGVPRLVGLEAKLKIAKVDVPEDVLRKLLYIEVCERLREYGLL